MSQGQECASCHILLQNFCQQRYPFLSQLSEFQELKFLQGPGEFCHRFNEKNEELPRSSCGPGGVGPGPGPHENSAKHPAALDLSRVRAMVQ